MKINIEELLLALKHLFPNSAPPDYNLRQNGDDTQITSWNLASSEPTEAEITQALIDAKLYNDTVNSIKATITSIENISGFSRSQREFLLAFSTDMVLKAKLEEYDTAIKIQRDALIGVK